MFATPFQSSNISTDILTASESGDFELVREILQPYFDPDFIDQESREQIFLTRPNRQGNTALHLASKQGHRDVVELLLYTGQFDLSGTNLLGYTPVELAAKNGRTLIVQLLLKSHEQKIFQPSYSWSSSSFGSTLSKSQSNYSFSKNQNSSRSKSVQSYPNILNSIHLAAKNGHIETLQLLMESFTFNPLIPSSTDREGNTIFHLCAVHRDTQILHTFLFGESPLSFNDKNRVASRLLSVSTIKNNAGDTILHVSADTGSIETLQFLLYLLKSYSEDLFLDLFF